MSTPDGSRPAQVRPRLECANCVIRDWARSDKAALIRCADNRRIWRNLTHRFPHPYTDADAEWWFGFLERMAEPTHWAIEVDDQAVGGIGVLVGEGVFAKSGHFGYWLGEEYWGRGIMTQAVKAVAPYVMSRFGLVRLEAPVFAWNPASMRVLEKCGFAKEGVSRASVFKDGELVDQVLYALVGGT
jgi:[ribosomal protein S5]-alanine N-acetyltransferase